MTRPIRPSKGQAPTSAAPSPAGPDAAPAAPAAAGGGERDILESNVGSLLSSAGDAPRISNAARQRIRAELLAASAAHTSRRWPRLVAFAGAAAVATAGVAVVVSRRGDPHEASAERAAGTHQLADGSTAEISSGSSLRVLGPRRVQVAGAVVLDVAPGKGRFVVETASGTVEALGTRFFVEATADHTSAAVIRGQVALRSGRDHAEVVLGAGEGGRVERGAAPVRQPVPRLSHLTSWVKTLREEREHEADPVRRGTLFARDPNFPDGTEAPLPMKQLTVDVVVDHRVARVAIDHTFHNAQDAVLEGMYRFALPPDAALQRFAMYVDGQLMESAVVERMRARRVYEDLVLRRVDPALLEYTGVGKLQMRVYPLAPRADKRIALAYTQSLPQLYDTWSLTVPLPKIDAPVDDVRFAIHLAACPNCEVTSPSHQVTVARKGDDLEVGYQARDAKVGDSLLLTVRDRREQATVARHRDGDDAYLLVRAPGKLDAAPAIAGRPAPRHWVILHDASASRGALERRAQAELIGALIRELDEDDQVSVTAFDVAPRQLLPFGRVAAVDATALAQALRRDDGGIGATDAGRALDAATEALQRAGATRPMIVYLGDGVLTAGDRKLDALRARITGKATFIGVGVGDGVDTQTLQGLAAATGGLATTIDLSDDLRWRVFDLVATLNTPRATGVSAVFTDAAGRQVPGALLRSPQLAEGEELEVVAKVPANAELVALQLTGHVGATPWQQRIELTAAGAAQQDTGYVPRLWAQREIDRLLAAKHEPVTPAPCTKDACPELSAVREARDESLRKQIVELGKRFFLLSRHTSLIVLENDAMYSRYGVTKGQGQTWAPYALPATLPKVAAKTQGKGDTVPAPGASPSAAPLKGELLRTPWQTFAELPGLLSPSEAGVADARMLATMGSLGMWGSGMGWGGGGGVGGGWDLERRTAARGGYATIGAGQWMENTDEGDDAGDRAPGDAQTTEGASVRNMRVRGDDDRSEDQRDNKTARASEEADKVKLEDQAGEGEAPMASSAAAPLGVTAASEAPLADAVARRSSGTGRGTMGYYMEHHLPWELQQLGVPRYGVRSIEPILPDLTALVPALALDELARARRSLRQLAPHPVADAKALPGVDPAAAQALRQARAALPAGSYRLGALELSLDAERRLGWRRVLPSGLEETAGFDGATLSRRYQELDLEVTNELAQGDDVAMQLAVFPLWIAPVESYARRFLISRRADGDIALTPRPAPGATGTGAPALILTFEANRLRRVRDGFDHVLAEVEWTQGRLTAATLRGLALEVGFTAAAEAANAAANAATARLSAPTSVRVTLPLRHPTRRAAELAATPMGSSVWRHGAHQLLVSQAVAQTSIEMLPTLQALLTQSALTPGELTLASSALPALPTKQQALVTSGDSAVARYLAHLVRRQAAPAIADTVVARWSAAPALPGALGAMLGYLQASELASGGGLGANAAKLEQAIVRADELPATATLWRAMLAADLWPQVARSKLPAERLLPLWASLGAEHANLARYQVALAYLQRPGARDREAGLRHLVQLFDTLDLRAAPLPLSSSPAYWFGEGEGRARFAAVHARWRDRVLAEGNFAHVMALAGVQQYDSADALLPALGRANALAGKDQRKVAAVAGIAVSRGMASLAWMLVRPLLYQSGDAALWPQLARFASMLAAQTSQPEEALRALELAIAAERAAGHEARASSVRGDYQQLLTFSKDLALRAQGAERTAAVDKALRLTSEWRSLDPAGPADRMMAQVWFGVGDKAAAFRLLSSDIDRDPMSGATWAAVAEQFQAAGRLEDSLPYWHEAVILDQTNPTWRIQHARALLALDRKPEARDVLDEVLRRRWHVRWEWTLYEARELRRPLSRGGR